MRIVVSGGGTGGHIYPALAVCEALRRGQEDCDLLYIGSVSGMEAEIVPMAGVPYQGVTARKLRKLFSVSTIGVGVSLLRGLQEARRYMRAYHPQAVVSTGGYVAAAAALAGASLGIPSLVLAPDSVPGRTNRMLARFAQQICVVFEETKAHFPAGKTVVTGLPLRSGVVAPSNVGAGRARCSFEALFPERFTVLVMGGSQGARALNDILIGALPELTRSGVQVLHQIGAANILEARTQVQALGLPAGVGYAPVAFLDAEQVSLAYRAADLIVCRGGISTLSEVLANGLPAIVVPLPTAYADHQTKNAQALAKAGAALCRPQADLNALGLAREIISLKERPLELVGMSAASRLMGRPDAADTVAQLILELCDSRSTRGKGP